MNYIVPHQDTCRFVEEIHSLGFGPTIHRSLAAARIPHSSELETEA
jgi:hypothetical protein